MLDDFRYALRLFRRSLGFTAGAVITIALAVGSTVAVLSALYGALLRPLPVADGDRLVIAYLVDRELRQETRHVSHVVFREWETSATTLTRVAAIGAYRFDLTGDGPARRVDVEVVSPGFFEVVGVAPLLGRTFSEPSATDGDEFPCVIGYDLWQSRYGGAADVLGRRVRSADLSFVIVGVMPRSFDRWRGKADVWVPIDGVPPFASVKTGRGYYSYHVIGRLRDGVAAADAAGELSRIAAATEPDRPEDGTRYGVNVRHLRDDVIGISPQRMLLSLGLMVALVWTIAVANVASLLLARNVGRARELAVRLAVGATRARMIRQLLSESLLLASAGTVAGLFIAAWMLGLLHRYGPASLTREGLIALDVMSGGLAVVGVAITTLAIGLMPAIGPLREIANAPALRSQGGTKTARLQDWFVAVQVGIAAVVVICTISVVRSFAALQQVDMGFRADAMVTLRVTPPARYFAPGDRTARRDLHQRVIEQVSQVASGREVALGDLPVPYPSSPRSFAIERGRRYLNGNPKDRPFTPGVHFVSTGYFRTLGIPVTSGRDFESADTTDDRHVAVVNRTTAQMHWPDQDPIGRRITFGNVRREGVSSEPWFTVVGVVGDVRYGNPYTPVIGEIYLPLIQAEARDFSLLVRTAGDPVAVSSSVQRAIQSIDPDISVHDARTISDRLADTTADVRYRTGLLAFFGVLALLLTAMGLNAVTAGRVARRQRELAVHAALGATPGILVGIVLRRTLAVLLVANAVGIGVALGAARWVASQFADVIAADLSTVTVAASTIVVIGTIAALVPALRAARIDPNRMLRAE